MKVFALAALFACVALAHGQTYGRPALEAELSPLDLAAPALDDEMIAEINSMNAGWTAGRNEFFEDKTIGDVMDMLMQDDPSDDLDGLPMAPIRRFTGAPTEFDGTKDKDWKKCVKEALIQDQGRCGSCWSFSINEALGIRHCLATGDPTAFSPQYSVSCDKGNGACRGGSGRPANDFFTKTGGISRDCVAYTSGNGKVPKCMDTCDDGSDIPEHFMFKDVTAYPNDEETLRSIYYEQGPSYTRFDVYQDFMSYKKGVYVHKKGRRLGGHAVVVVGWGTEDGVDYWLIGNSWGAKWGLNGYFKIARGCNECGIDAGNVGSTPVV